MHSVTPSSIEGPLEVIVRSTDGPLEWLPVIAVVGALVISGLGLYLTYKSRLSTARDQLHCEQIRLLLQYVSPLLDSAILCRRIIEKREREADAAMRTELKQKMQEFVAKAHAVFPDDICTAMWDYMHVVTATFGTEHGGVAPLTDDDVGRTFSRLMRVIRRQLGIDRLSSEATTLFGVEEK